MSTVPEPRRKPRRKPGNVRVEDRHWVNYKTKERTSRWKVDGKGKPVAVGKRWAVKWVDLQGAEKAMSFDKRTDADDYATKVTSELHTGTYFDPHTRGKVFSEVAETWKNSLVTKAGNTSDSHKSVLNNHVLPVFGDREVQTIDQADVIDWVAGLVEQDYAAATVHRCFVALRGVLALARPYMRTDPTAGVKLPKLAEPKDRFLSHGEVARLAAAADYLHALRTNRKRKGRDRAAELQLDRDSDGAVIVPPALPSPDGLLIRFLAYHGPRFGEGAALTVSDIDLGRGVLTISESASEKYGIGPTKSRKSRRVPVPKSLRAELEDHVTARRAQARLRDGQDPVWLFTAPEGGRLSRLNWSDRVLAPAVQLAELAPFTAHDLRHTFASLCASSGVRAEIVSRWMGHVDPGFTMRRYVGLFEADVESASDLLDAGIENPVRLASVSGGANPVRTRTARG